MSLLDKQNATLRLQEVDANLVISSVIHTHKIKIEKYGGTITAELNAEDSIINVDEMHFTNVIFNLLDNALKYRKEDVPPQLSISTRNIGDEKIEIVISDNGIGIKKEDIKKIFEKFYRVSTGNRHDVKGFGLGLAYVHKLITQFKGSIHVESELNVGSKFIILLPLIK
jgi:two-component system phosphate regulon sensor histidine kinase PhoR